MDETRSKVVDLDLNDILPNRFQPRIKFNEDSIIELSESIKEHGVIQPIIVRPIGDKYEIIAGERRYKASVLAGKDTIPAIISSFNDKDSAEVALIENVQRRDLTPIEEAISYKKILDMGYLTQEQLAIKLGKSQSSIANKIRLLNLCDEVQEALMEDKISERHARSLLKLKAASQQREMLKKIIENRLTVRKTEEEIEKMGTFITDPIDDNDTNPAGGVTSTPGFMNVEKEQQEAQDVVEQPKTVDFNSLLAPATPISETPNVDFSGIPSTPIVENPTPVSNSMVGEESSSMEKIEAPVIPNIVIPSSMENLVPPVPNLENGSVEVKPTSEEPTQEPTPGQTEQKPFNFQDLLAPTMPTVSQEVENKAPEEPKVPSPFDTVSIEPTPVEETPVVPAPSLEPVTPVIPENEPVESSSDPAMPIIPEVPSLNPEVPSIPSIPDISAIPSTPIIENNLPSSFAEVKEEPKVSETPEPVQPTPVVDTPPANDSLKEEKTDIQPIIITDYSKQYDPVLPPSAQPAQRLDFKEIINLIRQVNDTIEKCGYSIDTEEYDLENEYQVIFKISKN